MLPYAEGLALAPKVTARSVCGQEALAEADA
jgi:hypothetical protein